jgi:type IV pilus assembly protein PilM
MEEGQYCLNQYGTELLPMQSVVENNLVAIDKISDAIRNLIHNLHITRPYAAVAVSGSSVLTRIIQVRSNLEDDQIRDQIEVEADRYVPYPIEEVYYDFEIIGPSLKQPEFKDVLLACARIETVDSRVEAVHQAGLKVTIIDIEALVIERVFKLIAEELPDKGYNRNVALIDIGSTVTTLHVFRNLKSVYSRDQIFGGKHLIDEIQRRYGFSFETAMDSQKRGVLSEDYASSVLEPFKETVTQQIHRALQVFLSSSEEGDIQNLVLAGGVANIPGLVEIIQNSTGIPTIIANPFKHMKIAEGIDKELLAYEAPSILSSCGLALRNFD